MYGKSFVLQADIYKSVIGDVIAQVKEAFLDENVDIDILNQLKKVRITSDTWLNDKLLAEFGFRNGRRRSRRAAASIWISAASHLL